MLNRVRPEARVPVVLLGSILLVLFGRLAFSLLSPKADAGVAIVPAVGKKLVIKGNVRYPSDVPPSSSEALRVRLSIPEIALQKDVTLQAEAQGRFEIPVELPTDTGPLSYQIEAARGDSLWLSHPKQRLSLEGTGSEVIAESNERPYSIGQTELTHSLDSKAVSSLSQTSALLGEERRHKREQRAKQVQRRRQARREGRGK